MHDIIYLRHAAKYTAMRVYTQLNYEIFDIFILESG